MLPKYNTGALVLTMLASLGCRESTPPAPVAQISTVGLATPHPDGFWPRWSGPNADLISSETGWLDKWPAAGPSLTWKENVGTGFSSVTVAGGRLYTMGYKGGKDIVYCLDAVDGKEQWKFSYQCGLHDNLHDGGPGSTPTIDGDRVYTLSREGHLFCFAAQSGDVVWSKHLEDELGVYHPEWGFTCSPLILDQKLILDVGPAVALDKTNGNVIWQTEKYSPGYGSPNPFKYADTQFVTVLNNDGVIVVRASDGQVAAFHSWETDYATSSTTPILNGETLFISTGYRRGCALFRFDGNSLTKVYENDDMSNHMNNSVLWKGYLYGIHGQSRNSRTCRLVCMDHATGEVAWTQRGLGCGSLLIADGKLIVLSDKGILATVEATPTGYKEISRAQVLEGRCWTVPVLAGHRVYCRNADGDVVCVDLARGS